MTAVLKIAAGIAGIYLSGQLLGLAWALWTMPESDIHSIMARRARYRNDRRMIRILRRKRSVGELTLEAKP